MRKTLLLTLLFLVGCSDEPPAQDTGGPAQAKNQRPAAATRVLYGPARSSKLTPFPSNRYARADSASATGLRLAISTDTTGDTLPALYPSISSQLNEQDGFSTVGGVTVHFSGAVDPASFLRASDDYRATDSPLRLIDVDPSSPERGSARGLVVRYFPDESDGAQGGDFLLVAQPSTPLRQRTTYLFVVTDALKDASGAAVGASDEMALLLDGQQQGAYEQSIRDALGSLREPQALTAEHVALASLFTTETVHDQTFAMAAALRASPAPSLDGEVSVAQSADAPDGRISFRGRFTAPEWRSAEDGRWRLDAAGAPVVQSAASLEFLLVFSDRKPAGPRPIVIFAHGLSSSKAMTWDVAGWLADQGVAVIGIDAPEHGSRAPEGSKGDMLATAFSFFSVDLNTRTFNLTRGRDNFRQMASDQLQLVRALTGPLAALDVLPSGAPDGMPDLDTSRIAYLGQSFGALLGPAALALAPEVRGGALNVGGGGLVTIIHESPSFQILLPGLFEPGASKGDIARIFSAAQGLYDPGDPLNYAPFATLEAPPGAVGWSPRSVLVQEAVNDAVMPNTSTALLARTLGLAHVSPAIKAIEGVKTAPAPLSGNLSGGATGGIFQFNKVDGKTADHNNLAGSHEARAQYGIFLKSLFDGAPGVVVDPLASQP